MKVIAVIGLTSDYLFEKHGRIMELHFGLGWSLRTIADFENMSYHQIRTVLDKYYPKTGNLDIAIILPSKV